MKSWTTLLIEAFTVIVCIVFISICSSFVVSQKVLGLLPGVRAQSSLQIGGKVQNGHTPASNESPFI